MVFRRIIEKGNEVVFDQEGGRIINKAQGTEIPPERGGGAKFSMLTSRRT